MFHLLQLEWKKQKDYILFRILLLVYVVMLPAILMIGKKIPFEEGMPFNPSVALFNFPTVWGWLGYIGNWLGHFIFAFMAVLLVTNEHAFRTLRQNIITGMTRTEWFQSKALFLLVVALGATLYYALCALAFGIVHADPLYWSTVFKGAGGAVLRYFLMTLGFMSFGFLLGTLVKRTGIALFLLLAYTFMAEPVIRWALHFRLTEHRSYNWYPWNVFEDLAPVPFIEMTENMANEAGLSPVTEPTLAVVLALAYIGLFGWLGLRRLRSSDL